MYTAVGDEYRVVAMSPIVSRRCCSNVTVLSHVLAYAAMCVQLMLR